MRRHIDVRRALNEWQVFCSARAIGFNPIINAMKFELICEDTPVQNAQGLEAGRNVVGEIGFEPTTLWSQTRCATRLRYSPTGRNPCFRGFLVSIRKLQ
jgi:hypothetical protein